MSIAPDRFSRPSSDKPAVKFVYPTSLTLDLWEKICDAANQVHIALGCRECSLYDFRVHTETKGPYMLEVALFGSFSKIGMISPMVEANAPGRWSKFVGTTIRFIVCCHFATDSCA
mgnify:FL=1